MKGACLRAACGVAAALAVHLVIGWAWTLVVAIGVGFWHGRGGWLVGAASVGLSFVILIAYNFVVAPAPVGRMGEVMGGILGGLPAPAIFIGTGLIGFLIGTAGGGLGSGARLMIA